MVFTTNLFMLSKAFDYAFKHIQTICNIGIRRKLLINSLICHIREPVLVPEGTIACLPSSTLAHNITKLSPATRDYECSVFTSQGLDDALPTCDMVTAVLELHHSPTVEASLPTLVFGHFQNIVKWFIHGAVNTRM
jgi:hypothetical protein